MGQYHVTVNLTKREFLYPHTLGCGLKLLEQVDTVAGIPTALMVLLACSNGRGGGDFTEYDECPNIIGRWAGDRIAVVGDYAEDSDLAPEDHAHNIFDLCMNETERDLGVEKENHALYLDITPLVATYLERLLQIKYEGTGWRQVRDHQGKKYIPPMHPDMVITSNL